MYKMIFLETAFAATNKAQETATEQTSLFVDLLSNLGLWGISFFVFILTFPIASFIKKIITNRIVSHSNYELNKEVIILFERCIYFVVILVGTAIALSIVNVNFAQIVGYLGFGIGFAFKDILANIIAGVVILTQKTFKIGDIIKVSDRIGKITQIDMRITQVQGLDGTNFIVPNSDMVTNVVRNYTSNSLRRISFQVGVHYSTPLEMAIQSATDSVEKNKSVVSHPKIQVLAVEFGESAILLEVRFWIESDINWYLIRSEIIQQLKKDFDTAGITIPFPIRTLTLGESDKNLLEMCQVSNNSNNVIDPLLNSKTRVPLVKKPKV